MNPGARTEAAASERNFSFVDHKGEAQRQTADGVFEIFANQKDIGRTEAKILIAAQRLITVDIGATECGLEIKWHDVAARGHGKRRINAHTKTALKVPAKFLALRAVCALRGQAFVMFGEFVHGALCVFRVLIHRALVRPVGVPRHDKTSGLPIDGKLVRQIRGQALKRKSRVSGGKILLVGKVVIQMNKIIEEHRAHTDAFAKLQRAGLVRKSRRRSFRVERAYAGARLAGTGEDVHEASVGLAEECSA